MLSCNIGNYLIKRQSERYIITLFIAGKKLSYWELGWKWLRIVAGETDQNPIWHDDIVVLTICLPADTGVPELQY